MYTLFFFLHAGGLFFQPDSTLVLLLAFLKKVGGNSVLSISPRAFLQVTHCALDCLGFRTAAGRVLCPESFCQSLGEVDVG